jgi:hypothetical protein
MLTHRSASAPLDGECRHIVLGADLLRGAREGRERGELHDVGEICQFREPGRCAQFTLDLHGGRCRERQRDDRLSCLYAEGIERTSRIRSHAIERDPEAVTQNRRRTGAQVERLAERPAGLRRMRRAPEADAPTGNDDECNDKSHAEDRARGCGAERCETLHGRQARR